MWYRLTIQKPSVPSELSAEVLVPADSPWFIGHFPGNPILPGVAQLGMVLDLIRCSLGRRVRIAEVSRVRFKQMIFPDDRLALRAVPKPEREGAYAFRIVKNDELIASGVMTVAPDAR